jgi:hypothetical protein
MPATSLSLLRLLLTGLVQPVQAVLAGRRRDPLSAGEPELAEQLEKRVAGQESRVEAQESDLSLPSLFL